jgi:uncharacterized protein YneF (UPF0154 family)
MFNYETLWDIYEMKILIFFISIVVAVMLGNYLYDKTTKKKDD